MLKPKVETLIRRTRGRETASPRKTRREKEGGNASSLKPLTNQGSSLLKKITFSSAFVYSSVIFPFLSFFFFLFFFLYGERKNEIL
jgi:hypothetical protein